MPWGSSGDSFAIASPPLFKQERLTLAAAVTSSHAALPKGHQRTRPREQFRQDSPNKRTDMQPAKNRARACQQAAEDDPRYEERVQEENEDCECRIDVRHK